jgi:hypothetical protein
MRLVLCTALVLDLMVPLAAEAAPPPSKGPPRSKSAAPLALAAWKPDHQQIEALLAAGENANAPGMVGFTPWMWSLVARDRTGFRMLFDSVRDFRPADPMTATIFLFQAVADEREVVSDFLKRGVSPNAQVGDGTTALMAAAASGHAEMVGLLLEHGADANLADQQGDTALMSAVRAGSLGCIQRLLAKAARVDQRDKAGNRAMTYAMRSGRQDVQSLLGKAGAQLEVVANETAPASAKLAVGKSLPLLERATKEWIDGKGCNACHMQPVMLRVNAVARAQGFATDPAVLGSLEQSTRHDLGPDFARFAGEAIQTDEGVAVASQYVGGDEAFTLALSLSSALEAGLRRYPYDRSTALLMARMQQPDGSWRHGPDRVPMQSGDITSTALAARVLRAFPAKVQQDDLAGRVARARAWLVTSVPKTTDDAAFRLLGLRWLDAGPALLAAATATLESRQLTGGGWSQIDGLNPDAYATGLALVALHEGANVPGSHPAYRKGVEYLLRTQYPDGSWLVHKRSVPVNKYFESGFPHGKFQFSSFVGTAWATMALMYEQPDKAIRAGRNGTTLKVALSAGR